MLIAHALTGVRILIAHEDRFQRTYLSDALIAAGATVVDRPVTLTAGELSRGGPAIEAVVMSQVMQATDDGGLLDAARRGSLAVLVVHSSSVPPLPLPLPENGLLRSLGAPYAAFQVVDVLRDMLARRHDRAAPL